MNIFSKISQFFSQIFKSEAKEQKPISEKEFMAQQRLNLKKVKENLTELIFQRKKLESQVGDLGHEAVHLKEDLETAAFQDKDQLALHLMSRQEDVESELSILSTHLEKVREEIEKTKELETSLADQLEQSRIQFSVLKSREQAVGLRQKLQSDLHSVSGADGEVTHNLKRVHQEILRMEASLEALDSGKSDFQADLRSLRKGKVDRVQQRRLRILKESLKGRKLPEAIEVPAKRFVEQVAKVH